LPEASLGVNLDAALRFGGLRADLASTVAFVIAVVLGKSRSTEAEVMVQFFWAVASLLCDVSMEKILMTRAGSTVLEDELRQLKSVERPAVIRAIAEAREHGDLSENAEYHSAREKQSFIEGRIKEIEAIISLAEVIDPTKLSGSIKFGATVTLLDEETDEERVYQIVGEPEADLERGLLNIRAPLARALIGRDEGDSVEVKTPGGSRGYEILAVRYI